MSATTSRSKTRKDDITQKRLPKNPKYKDVEPTIDTGASMSKYMKKIEEIRQNYRYRSDEIFKRMKITTFVQLVVQVSRITSSEQLTPVPNQSRLEYNDQQFAHGDDEENDKTADSPRSLALTEGDFGVQSGPDTVRSTLLSVSRGIGELDINKPEPKVDDNSSAPSDDLPYLLLDVRERDEHETSHIRTAESYPKAYLSRATNYESKSMLLYKNKPGKIIVIYDEDERIAPMAATTLVQRGYDNLFMLSGGLKVASKLFPEGLCAKGTNTKFSMQDVDKLEIYLDNALDDHSIGSRLSKASTAASKASSRSSVSRSSLASDGRPPFKPI